MRATKFHIIFSSLVRLWNLSFLCCFFMLSLFRNELVYIIEQAVHSSHLSVNYELWDNDLSSDSSEIEIEKQEVILSDVFTDHFKTAVIVKEQLINNCMTSQGNTLSVYLEVLSPPPRCAA